MLSKNIVHTNASQLNIKDTSMSDSVISYSTLSFLYIQINILTKVYPRHVFPKVK